jgi:hypothetical protein
MLQVMRCGFVVLLFSGLASLCGSAKAAVLCANVFDLANLPLPDASVTAVNLGTNKRFGGRSDRTGKACIPALPEGLYSVEVALTGFLNVRYYPVRLAPVATHELRFQLPFGEITEGSLAQESTLSGTLKQDGAPIQSAKICIFASEGENAAPVTCSVTNDLGEYAIIVPVGIYTVELRLPQGTVQRSKIDLSNPGFHRNSITVARQ